ncbi:MAG TPA: thioesterase family protein [Blastocatellia bacterium]
MLEIPVGIAGTKSLKVTREYTVASHVPGMPEVFATPMMIYLMETSASDLIAPYLPEGWISVGVHVDVKHLAATPASATVRATATIKAVKDNTIVFAVEAYDEAEKIGEGTHVRAAVELSRFLKRLSRKTSEIDNSGTAS